MKEKVKENRLIKSDKYLLEVEVEFYQDEDDPWAPYYTTEVVKRMYNAKKALIQGDLDSARKFGRLYRITPEEAELDLSSV